MSKLFELDSRSFVRMLNESAQANIKQFEERIAYMGKELGKTWKLAALHQDSLLFEDENNNYYIAEHKKNNGKVVISNIRSVEITEGKKKEMFSESCLKLINAIESNNQKAMASAFGIMKSQRFSSRIVPNSGNIVGKDGVVRKVNVSSGSISEESIKKQIVKLVVESMTNRVVLCEDKSVVGEFTDGARVKLPLTEWGKRKLVARRMRQVAENAYWSEGFQNRLLELANLVAADKIEEAVQKVKPFLEEMEEFTLLNRSKMQKLVESTLAAKAIFNQQLCEDVATLMYKTNLKVNKPKIVAEWKNIGKKLSNHALVENVSVLESASDFEAAYEKFLHMIFENISNRDVTATALATTLESLKEKTPKIKESYDLSSKLVRLIQRLKNPNFDDAAIYEAQDLIATIQEELSANDSLSQFDSMPGSDSDMSDTMDLTNSGGGAPPVININSPLIQIGGTSGAKPDAGPEVPEDMSAEFPEDNMDDLLGQPDATPPPGGPGAPAPGAPAPGAGPGAPGAPGAPSPGGSKPPFPMESKKRKGTTKVTESSDPYAYSIKESAANIKEYGMPIIKDAKTIEEASSLMAQIANKRSMSGSKLAEKLPKLAEAVIKSMEITVPEGKKSRAINQLVEAFESNYSALLESEFDDTYSDSDDSVEEWRKPWEKKDSQDTEEVTDQDDEEGLAEDQYKLPKIKKRGLKRSSINKSKDTTNESKGGIKWIERQEDAVLGEMNGIKFVFDHGNPGSNLDPVILSEDNSIEIPIPSALVDSAYASANLKNGNAAKFNEWLSRNIVQLQPISEDDEQSFDEVLATIKRGEDGKIVIDVESDEVGVNDTEDLDSEEFGDTDDMNGLDEVSSMDMDDDSEIIDDEDVMPDFEEGYESASAEDETLDDESEEDFGEEGESDDEDSEGSEDEDFGGEESEEEDSDDEDSEDEDSEDEDLDDEDSEFSEVDEIDFESPEDAMCEDDELTSPEHAKYTKHVNDNKREAPKVKLPKDNTDDELEGFDNDKKLEEYDGTGDKSVASKNLKN